MDIKRLLKPTKLRFAGKRVLGPNAYAFGFISTQPLKWKAGQQALLDIPLADGRRSIQSFPIVSAPCERTFVIATRVLPEKPDSSKQILLKLKVGEYVNIRAIFGRTVIKNIFKEYAFLTTGIGIAVFRAILKQLVYEKHFDTKITLFFVGNKDSHYFKDELEDFREKLKNLRIEYIYKPERITGQVLEDKMGQRLFKTIYFIAGSPILVRNYRRLLTGLNVPARLIKSNHYRFIKHHQHENPAEPTTLVN